MGQIQMTRGYRPIFRPILIAVALVVGGALALDSWRSMAPVDRPATVPLTMPAEREMSCNGVSAPPLGNPASWVTPDDYPAAALRAQHQGTVAIGFDIGPDGAIRECRVTGSSGHGELDAAACALVTRRGRYTPPRDAGGCSTTVTKTLRFTWRLPED